ncbi:MAG TPA: glycosyltransferase family A protein [bacterium]|nr:glycosyltransferase family A protein [bacterium]
MIKAIAGGGPLTFSVVLPTFNNARMLPSAIEALLAQETDAPYEIIVVDNNSSDETRSVVRSYARRARPEVRYVLEQTQGSSAARNAGIRVAQGEVVAFTDDDCAPAPDWLQVLAATYGAYPEAWCVGGKIALVLPDACPLWFRNASPRYDMAAFFAHLDMGEGTIRLAHPRALWTANFSARRSTFTRVGVFETALGISKSGRLTGEDLEFCYRTYRSGGIIYYCGQAVVRHSVRASRMTKRYFRYGAYWGGRTAAHPLIRGPISTGGATHAAAIMAKDCVKMLAYYAVGRGQRAFECELAIRQRVGSAVGTIGSWFGG